MEQLVAEAVKWVVPAVLGGMSAWALKGVGELRTRDKALGNGVGSLLKCELVRAHARYVMAHEPMRAIDFAHVQSVYEAYHGLGLNGVGTKIFNEIANVPIAKE